MKTFVCVYKCRMGNTELTWQHLAEGENEEEVSKAHEVEHKFGLDTENSPIGDAAGQYYTELIKVIPVTPNQKKFLNEIGIH
jgi:hypothetical protein